MSDPHLTSVRKRFEANRKDQHSVFICYTWDDSTHMKWVKCLADTLRLNGCSVVLDQDEQSDDPMFPVTIGIGCNTILIVVTRPLYDRSIAELPHSGSFQDGWFLDEFQLIKLNFGKIGRVGIVYRSGDRCFFSFPIFDFSTSRDVHGAVLSLLLFIRGYELPNRYYPNPVFGTVRRNGNDTIGWMSPLHEYENKHFLSNVVFTSIATFEERVPERYQVGKREHPHELTF